MSSHYATNKPWLHLFLPAALSALGWLYAEYHANDRVDVQRLTAVETKQQDTTDRLDRIENKVDNLDNKLDRLLDHFPSPK